MSKLSSAERKTPYLCAVEADFRERNTPGPNLHLTTRFSDDVVTFGPIRIRVAIYLNFQLSDCEFPLACNLEQTWPIKEKSKLTVKKRSTQQAIDGNQITATASAIPSLKLNDASKVSHSATQEIKSEGTTTWQHVFWRGTLDGPSLVFDCRPNQKFLSGTLLGGELVGSVEPKSSSNYDIAIELEIPKSGLLLEHGDEFTAYPNKRGLMKIVAALALCRKPIRLHKRSFKK